MKLIKGVVSEVIPCSAIIEASVTSPINKSEQQSCLELAVTWDSRVDLSCPHRYSFLTAIIVIPYMTPPQYHSSRSCDGTGVPPHAVVPVALLLGAISLVDCCYVPIAVRGRCLSTAGVLLCFTRTYCAGSSNVVGYRSVGGEYLRSRSSEDPRHDVILLLSSKHRQ